MAWKACVQHFYAFIIIVGVLTVGPTVIGSEIAEELSEDVIKQCQEKCPFQNRTGDGHYDFGCGMECSIEQCNYGCKMWSRALESSCQAVCNITTEVLSPRELYCVMGCNGALNNYFQRLKEKIGTPPAPALVADSLTSSSLSLEWEGSRHSNLSYLVQWRYEEVAGAWQYCRNQTWGHHSVVRVENLQPYTKYRFRVAVLLSARHSDPIVSAPSVVISTLPFGPPTSAPIELRVTAVDSHRISLSWEAGPFPNGPILSYVLRISETRPHGYSAVKDLPASENSLFYMFQSLSPSVSYTVGVAMRNGEGEGPEATVLVTTPHLPTAVTSQQPILILGERHTVLQQAADMFTEPIVLYSTKQTIQGVGIDVNRDLLFVSDSSGSVFKSSLSHQSAATAILTQSLIAFKPLDLSVDWLNGHLYILGEVNHNSSNIGWREGNAFVRWQVVRCDFDGRSQTVAFAGFHSKPVHIEVDPYNGYLFWALQGITSGGLYRLDLADISNGVRHEVTPYVVMKEPNLGAFTVDHTNFRILVPHLVNNTVLSVSLDGREHVDFRQNTQRPMFDSVHSLSFANGLFYWTNGKQVLTEEYHRGQDSYFHNVYPDLRNKTLSTVLVALKACQPIPVAVNPPIGLQSVMGTHHAKITWQPPHLLGHQGNGAWQHWHYHLQITDADKNITINRSDINGTTTYIAKDLKEDTVYVIKAAAVTSSGIGPWSSEFTAKTLSTPQNGVISSMLWSAQEGLLKSDLTGDNVQTLIHKSQLLNIFITDISWYRDQLYLVTNASSVMWFNMTSNDKGWIHDMDNVGSLAVDWIGRKLYWSSPKQQLITRGNLRGGNREPVPIVTVGKELKIDSMEGYIYWNTGHAIECARLNGEHKITYYPAQLFRKQVMGLTVDLRGKLLYWIVHGYEGSNLYKSPTADKIAPGTEVSNTLISSLSGAATIGPLCYFSNRLMWLQDDSHAVISDLTGHNKANLNGITLAFVNMIAVVDPNLQSDTNDKEAMSVIPEPVNQTSIKIVGEWDSFNITWSPITKVNYGQVFYEIKIEYDSKIHEEYTTEEPLVQYSGGSVPPFSSVEMSVRAYTYWGAAAVARTTLRSPQAPPMHPTSPRVYIQHHTGPIRNENEVTAIFRWNEPLHANGIVKGYRVDCWYKEDGIDNIVCQEETVPPQNLQYIAKNVLRNVTYFFQVQAYTDAGYGSKTLPVSALTDVESPIPKLALAFHDSIKVADLDLGDGYTYTVSRSAGKPVDFAVSMREGLVYWVNEVQEIFVSRMDETGHTKVLSINGTAVSIAVDWVTRMLYWSQLENSAIQYGCTVYRMDLNVYHIEGLIKVERILQRNVHIQRLQVSPITRSLYWVEMNHHGMGTLMTASTTGSYVRTFFSGHDHSSSEEKQCNCAKNPSVGRSFTLDLTMPDDAKLFWVDPWSEHIFTSDLQGCKCKVVVNATQFKDHALPPSFITIDSKFIYWSNASQTQLYSAEKSVTPITKITQVKITNGHKILALGNRIQPYPPKNCLSPKQMPLEVTMLNRTFDSLTLMLPPVVKYYMCENYSIATPYYTVFYQPYVEGENISCNQLACAYERTFEKLLHLDGLRSFSNYGFSVQVSNYYGDLRDVRPVMGPTVVYRTSAGAPAPAVNVRAQVLTPNLARVEWSTPTSNSSSMADLSTDPDVWYEVHWRTEGTVTPDQGVKEHNTYIAKTKSQRNITHTQLPKLMPAQNYSVWVRTQSYNSDIYTDSQIVSFETFPEPSDIVITFLGAYVMHVSWMPYHKMQILNHSIEYAEYGPDNWKKVEDEGSQKSDSSINYVVQNLLPKTQYKFRLKLFYINNTIPYIWPQDSPFLFETLGDRPSPPGKPIVQQLSGAVYQLQWAPSLPHGSAIRLYRLFGHARPTEEPRVHPHRISRQIDMRHTDMIPTDNGLQDQGLLEAINSDISSVFGAREKRGANYSRLQSDIPYFSLEDNTESMVFEMTDEPFKGGWKMLYNGSDNYWIIAELKLSERYTFYVQALNAYGWSDFSDPSEEFDFSQTGLLAIPHDYVQVTLGIGVTVFLTLSLAITACICLMKRRDKKSSLNQLSPGQTIFRGPDVELATLRELPRSRGGGGMFQQSTNILYNGGLCQTPTDADIALLSHIMREQITLTKFLGSGAFGEVFEGKAKNLEQVGSEIRVAVKTLRKGATDQEKTEFLQEAQLMSNFKHEHILRMLGVCLDNDPHFIIMELMEGGDLLSYLRARRPMLYSNDSLTLHDLLSMCLDVTKGCRYLEEMRFVHRDLACRNCLVSNQVHGRVVKIGDFGLARDIYKNDYYRKEGEGLLPVRWMAVECLTDGVFSCASDVWAWAVLCWEVAALGRQPYPALPNHAVMRYVRNGGTLPRPPNCPPTFFNLLQRCWSYNPDHRPTFKHCLEVLEAFMETIPEDVFLTGTMSEEPQYITVVPDVMGVSNRAYFTDDFRNNNNSGDMDSTSFSEPSDVTPDAIPSNEIVQIPNTPKYLELIYDSDNAQETIQRVDGYEVPRSSIRSNASRNTLGPQERAERPCSVTITTNPRNSLEKSLTVKFLPPDVSGIVYNNRNSVSMSEPSSLRRLLARGDSFTGTNDSAGHISDDEKISQQNSESEAIRLLNNGAGGSLRMPSNRDETDIVGGSLRKTMC